MNMTVRTPLKSRPSFAALVSKYTTRALGPSFAIISDLFFVRPDISRWKMFFDFKNCEKRLSVSYSLKNTIVLWGLSLKISINFLNFG